MQTSEWIAKDSQDNALATATKAAVANRRHVITGVIASFSGASTKLLQIKHGTTVVLELYVANSAFVEIPGGLRNPAINEAVSAELAASGTAAMLGKVALLGYTI